MIDLHVHTTYSDGSDSVEDIFKEASRIKLSTISITDHDSTSSYKEADILSKKYNINFLRGVEVSTRVDNWEYHILGYFIDETKDKFSEFLKKIRDSREIRNVKLIKLLNELGYEVTLDDLLKSANKKKNIGRPHFARMLIEKGYFKNIPEVFDKLLADGHKGYIARESVTPCEAIKAIHKNGGIAVLAHPFSYRLKRKEITKRINQFIKCGLDGLEIIYVTHKLDEINFLKKIAKENDLLITGGSDYHGKFKPNIKLGVGLGKLSIPDKLVDALNNFKR